MRQTLGSAPYVGQCVIANGHRGTVTEVLTGQLAGMVNVRLGSGTVCVEYSYPDCYAEGYDPRYEYVVCPGCGQRHQRIDFAGNPHALYCAEANKRPGGYGLPSVE